MVECWSIGVVEKNKDWSNGMLGVKAEIDLIFTLLPLTNGEIRLLTKPSRMKALKLTNK